jgi:hypothetical protein
MAGCENRIFGHVPMFAEDGKLSALPSTAKTPDGRRTLQPF